MDLSKESIKKINKILALALAIGFIIWMIVAGYQRQVENTENHELFSGREVVEFTYYLSEGDYQFKRINNDTAYIQDRGDVKRPYDFEYSQLANSETYDLNLKKTPYVNYRGDYSLTAQGVEKTSVLFDVQIDKKTNLKQYSNPQVLDIYYEELEMIFSSRDKQSKYKLHEQFNDDIDLKPIYADIFIYMNDEGKHAFTFLARPKFILSDEYIDEVYGDKDYSNIHFLPESNNDNAYRYICIEDEGCKLLEEEITEEKYLERLGFKTEEIYFADSLSAFVDDFNYTDKIKELLPGISIQQKQDNFIEFGGNKEDFSQYKYFDEYLEDFTSFNDDARVQIMIDGGEDPFIKLLEIFKTNPSSLDHSNLSTSDFNLYKFCEEESYKIDSFEKLESYYYNQQKCWLNQNK